MGSTYDKCSYNVTNKFYIKFTCFIYSNVAYNGAELELGLSSLTQALWLLDLSSSLIKLDYIPTLFPKKLLL